VHPPKQKRIHYKVRRRKKEGIRGQGGSSSYRERNAEKKGGIKMNNSIK